MLASRNEITLSPSHLAVLHASMLDSSDSPSKKKKVSLSFKVSTFLLGHVEAWKSLSARVKLLLALEGVKEKDKSNVLVQLVDESISLGSAGRTAFAASSSDEVVQSYAKLLLQPYDGVSRKWLESEDSSAFATLLKSFEILDIQGKITPRLENSLLARSTLMSFASFPVRSRCLHAQGSASSRRCLRLFGFEGREPRRIVQAARQTRCRFCRSTFVPSLSLLSRSC